MTGRLRAAFARHPILTSGFLIAAALCLFFGARLLVSTVYWFDPAHRDQAIAGWMTPGYVGHSWHVPREVVAAALGLEKGSGRPGRSLQDLADARGVPLDELIGQLNSAIAEFRASHD